MNATTITTAGLESLDELGLDKLTMRAVADRLGVRVGGLYYHVPDKSGLLRLMADRLCAEIADAIAPADGWRAQTVEICLAVRGVLLAHRDGARIFAGSPLVASTNALALMDRLLGHLGEAVPEARAGVAGDTLFSYITGYVLQEQHDAAGAGSAEAFEELRERFPRVFAAAGGAGSPEDTFRTSVDAIIDGFVR